MTSDFYDVRHSIIEAARSLYGRGLTHGSTGNISARAGENILITPTGSSLGTVTAEELSVIDLQGRHVDGAKPSKEAFLHAAVFRVRPRATSAVHTHSTHAVAVSCLAGLDANDVLPPLTAYYAMRIGRLPMLPYFAPGDDGLEEAAEETARSHTAMLLRNHGPIVAGTSVTAALDAVEELEATAKIFLLTRGMDTNSLTPAQREALSGPKA